MKISLIEKLLINLYTPFEIADIRKYSPKNFESQIKKLVNSKISDYSMLLRHSERNGEILPVVKSMYTATPCGRIMLRVYEARQRFS
jgi:hypothetical protein